jgi:hypothetical protein
MARYEAIAAKTHWIVIVAADGTQATEPGDIEVGDVVAMPGISDINVTGVRFVSQPYEGEDCDYVVVVDGDDEFGDDWTFLADLTDGQVTLTIYRDDDL